MAFMLNELFRNVDCKDLEQCVGHINLMIIRPGEDVGQCEGPGQGGSPGQGEDA